MLDTELKKSEAENTELKKADTPDNILGRASETSAELPRRNRNTGYDQKKRDSYVIKSVAAELKQKIDEQMSKAESEDESSVALETGNKSAKQFVNTTKRFSEWQKEDKQLKQENTDAQLVINDKKVDMKLAEEKADIEFKNALDMSDGSDKDKLLKLKKRRQQEIYNDLRKAKGEKMLEAPVSPKLTDNMSAQYKKLLNGLYNSQKKEYKANKRLEKINEPKIKRRKTLLEEEVRNLGSQAKQFTFSEMEKSDDTAVQASGKGLKFVSSTANNLKHFHFEQKKAEYNKLKFQSVKENAKQTEMKKSISRIEQNKQQFKKTSQKKRNQNIFDKDRSNKAKGITVKSDKKPNVFSFLKNSSVGFWIAGITAIVIIIVMLVSIIGMTVTYVPAIAFDTFFAWFVKDDSQTDEQMQEDLKNAQKQLTSVLNQIVENKFNPELKAHFDLSNAEYKFVDYPSKSENWGMERSFLAALAALRIINNEDDSNNYSGFVFSYSQIENLAEYFFTQRDTYDYMFMYRDPEHSNGGCMEKEVEHDVYDKDGNYVKTETITVHYCCGHPAEHWSYYPRDAAGYALFAECAEEDLDDAIDMYNEIMSMLEELLPETDESEETE